MIYSSVGRDCQNGMVAVINPGTVQTLAQYRNNTKVSAENVGPKEEFGGVMDKKTPIEIGKGGKIKSGGSQLILNLATFIPATLALCILVIYPVDSVFHAYTTLFHIVFTPGFSTLEKRGKQDIL